MEHLASESGVSQIISSQAAEDGDELLTSLKSLGHNRQATLNSQWTAKIILSDTSWYLAMPNS